MWASLRPAAMPKKAGNAVNEFDETAWNTAFSQMTEERKGDDEQSIATKDAMMVVQKLLDSMKTRYGDHLGAMESSVETFGKVSRFAFTHLARAPPRQMLVRYSKRTNGGRSDTCRKDVATVEGQLNKIKEQLGAPAEGVPPS